MILILVAIVMSIVLAALLFVVADSDDGGWKGFIAGLTAVILSISTAVTIICYCYLVWEWQASAYKVAIINREYGTKYTREEIFYATNVIDTIREIDRKRIEINGNVLKGKESLTKQMKGE